MTERAPGVTGNRERDGDIQATADSADSATTGDTQRECAGEASLQPGDLQDQQGDPELRYGELNERFLRLAADFENYKRRTERDREAYTKFATEQFAVALLEVADNLERAESAKGEVSREGLTQIRKLLMASLERFGVRPLDASGKAFNPAEHEAVTAVPSDLDEGMVVDEICKGYCMYNRIIRCAKVTVSKGRECA